MRAKTIFSCVRSVQQHTFVSELLQFLLENARRSLKFHRFNSIHNFASFENDSFTVVLKIISRC